KVDSNAARALLADGLIDNSPAVRVAAADALITSGAQEIYGRISEIMFQIVQSNNGELRQRAGSILSKLPGGLDAVHRPIQDALLRGDAEGALQLTQEELKTFPEDVDLFWWKGHALKS